MRLSPAPTCLRHTVLTPALAAHPTGAPASDLSGSRTLPLALAVGGAGAPGAMLPTIDRKYAAGISAPPTLPASFAALQPLTAGKCRNSSSAVCPPPPSASLQIFIAIGLLAQLPPGLDLRFADHASRSSLWPSATAHQSWHSSAGHLRRRIVLGALCRCLGRCLHPQILARRRHPLRARRHRCCCSPMAFSAALILGQGFSPRPSSRCREAAYFTVVTMSTVGYGDILPKSDNARLFVISLIIVGLSVFLTSLTAVVGPLIQGRLIRIIEPRRKKMKRSTTTSSRATARSPITPRESCWRGTKR